MGKILYNPEDGSTITDVIVGGTMYFSEKEDLEFKPGEIVKIEEDNVADVILETFGFLQAISVEQAKGIKERKENNKFKCDKPGCKYSTDEEKKLHGHSLTHSRQEKIDKELGIRVVQGKKKAGEKEVDVQAIIDQEASNDGLIGEGLTKE